MVLKVKTLWEVKLVLLRSYQPPGTLYYLLTVRASRACSPASLSAMQPVSGQRLFVAMAGTHQIWEVSLDSNIASNYSGDGQEMNRNNTNRLKGSASTFCTCKFCPLLMFTPSASWAQPSGLSIGPAEIYVADAESSTIRAIHLTNGKTRTVVGGDIDPKNLVLNVKPVE